MKISRSYLIAAPRERVFERLTDPEVLQKCIPGCESMTYQGEGIYLALVRMGLPGLKGLYQGRAEMKDLAAPASYTLAFDGKGGQNIVRGTAQMRLEPTGDDATEIVCDADVQAGGVLASVASHLIHGTAKSMMDTFFKAFRSIVEVDRTP